MVNQNLLQIHLAPAAPKGNGNPRGRPCKTHSINHGPKPRSMVSQIIEDMIISDRIRIPIEWKTEKEQVDYNNDSILFEVPDQLDYSHSTPKKKSKNKTKVVETEIYHCEFANCIYNTKLSSNLEKHKRTHTGEKPYLCDRCSFRTNFSNSLKVHKRLHTKERPYQCKHCDYRCNSISNLKKHCHNKHKDIKYASENNNLQMFNEIYVTAT